jgi:hypothetical protein
MFPLSTLTPVEGTLRQQLLRDAGECQRLLTWNAENSTEPENYVGSLSLGALNKSFSKKA